MLKINVVLSESVDENKKFVYELFPLELEHSLASMSKWESKFAKPFLDTNAKTTEEVRGYIECMTLTPNVPPEVFLKLSNENIQAINEYIESKQSATWFSDSQLKTQSSEVVTAEIVYYWMSSMQIPWEAQHWHLNRLFTLIRVFDLKNAKPKPMSRSEQLSRQRALNEERRKKYGTSG